MKTLDYDRISEDDENFLELNNEKEPNLDKRKLKPITNLRGEGVITRTVLGSADYFNKTLQMKKEAAYNRMSKKRSTLAGTFNQKSS